MKHVTLKLFPLPIIPRNVTLKFVGLLISCGGIWKVALKLNRQMSVLCRELESVWVWIWVWVWVLQEGGNTHWIFHETLTVLWLVLSQGSSHQPLSGYVWIPSLIMINYTLAQSKRKGGTHRKYLKWCNTSKWKHHITLPRFSHARVGAGDSIRLLALNVVGLRSVQEQLQMFVDSALYPPAWIMNILSWASSGGEGNCGNLIHWPRIPGQTLGRGFQDTCDGVCSHLNFHAII